MAKNTIFIPKLCKVGFNPRSDTYTGYLGYVIYYDGKKWRKITSWENWIYDYISDEEYQEIKNEQYKNKIQMLLKKWEDGKRRNSYYVEGRGWKYLDDNIETREEAEKVFKYEEFKPNIRRKSPDEKIKPFEFDNVPTEGFVLNKKAGGDRYGWNPRQTYCRVYDPRGFEFEITIPNLLYILENTNSIKGKGLEGKFVYGWDGKELVLIPESAPEYKAMMEYTKLQDGKVYKRNMVPGNIYVDKNMNRVTYMGDAFELNYWKNPSTKKKVWFCTTHNDGSYYFESKSNVSTIKIDTGEIDKDFANKIDAIEKHKYYYSGKLEYELIRNPIQRLKSKLSSHYSNYTCYVKIDGKIKKINIEKYRYNYDYNTIGGYTVRIGNDIKKYSSIKEIIEENELWQLKMTK